MSAALRLVRRTVVGAALALHHLLTTSAALVAVSSATTAAFLSHEWAAAWVLTAAALALVALRIRAEDTVRYVTADCPLCTIARRRAHRKEYVQ